MRVSLSVPLLMLMLTAAAPPAFAQQGLIPRPTNETFLSRTQAQLNNGDHPWTEWHESRRFQLLYHSTEAPISQANANIALNELEEIFDVFVYDNGFQHPYHNRAENRRYKMCVYVLRPGEGHAFGGVTGPNNSTVGNTSGPGMWLSSGAVDDKWALAHEFMHGLQSMAGGMGGGDTDQGTNLRGWFYESHANLMPHVVYPNEVHYCAEMYTRMPQAYLGSTRNRYCNWQFFEYVIHRYGVKAVNDLWISPPVSSTTAGTWQNPHNHDPFTELMARNDLSQRDFGDLFGDFAMKAVIWDINQNSAHRNPAYAARGSALFRGAFNSARVNERFKRSRYTYLEALDSTDGANGRFVVPFAAAPQRYGYNIIRLYPDNNSDGAVKVRFRGDVQTKNNIPDYSKTLNLEPAAANLPDDPGSDWRYGLVAVTGDADAAGGTVTARYGEVARASDGSPDITMETRNGETQLYLVVAATPTIHHKISWDQFYYTIYRFPYMVEITGARPEGFQELTYPSGGRHANGGGFVASAATVAATAYVGQNARVLRGTVSGGARIEGRAVIDGGAVSDNAVVRDYAYVRGGTISGRAVVGEGANIWGGIITDSAYVGGITNVMISGGGRIAGGARVTGAPWIDNVALNLSGTAQLYGDGEVYGVTASRGCFTGIVDAGAVASNQHGANRTELPVEVTAPRSMRWYGDGNGPTAVGKNTVAGKNMARRFTFDSRGILRYDLGGAAFGNLKIFDSRGRVVKSMRLSGSGSSVNANLRGDIASQMLFWRVDVNGAVVGRGRILF